MPAKRKRDTYLSSAPAAVRTELLDLPKTKKLRPGLASIPSTLPPPDLGFDLYKNSSTEEQELHGASSGVWYTSTLSTSDTSTISSGSYILCKYSRKSGLLSILPASPLHTIVPSPPETPLPPTATQLAYTQARTDLTAAFGSKRTLRTLATRELNVLKKDGLGNDKSLAGVISEAIDQGSKSFMSNEEITKQEVLGRPIPPVNTETSDKSEVYAISKLIPHIKTLDVDALEQFQGTPVEAGQKFSYYRHSKFLSDNFETLFGLWTTENTKANKKKVGVVLYLGILLSLNRYWPFVSIPLDYQFKQLLAPLPDVIKEDLLDTFTEFPEGATTRIRTPHTKHKLLSYIAAICLHIANFKCPLTQLAADLSKPEKELGEVFKSLGCKIEKTSAGKFAVLDAPVKFPQPKVAGNRARR